MTAPIVARSTRCDAAISDSSSGVHTERWGWQAVMTSMDYFHQSTIVSSIFIKLLMSAAPGFLPVAATPADLTCRRSTRAHIRHLRSPRGNKPRFHAMLIKTKNHSPKRTASGVGQNHEDSSYIAMKEPLTDSSDSKRIRTQSEMFAYERTENRQVRLCHVFTVV